MPPSLREWLPEDHLVWAILGSVEEMDLDAFYSAYRADGHGRAAYEPSMMVALLLYAYACGNRSSRGIERECRDDVGYRVIAANRVPDHSTIAEFRCRHEEALAGLFGEVLVLCREAGLLNVGLVAIDGTKVSANASSMTNRDYRQVALEILAEADRIDREEDALYGASRGDELPEHLRTAEGRRKALKEAKERLRARAERSSDPMPRATPRLAWRWCLIRRRSSRGCKAVPVGCARLNGSSMTTARVIRGRCHATVSAGCWRASSELVEDLAVEREANQAYEAYRARGVMKNGRRFGGPPKAYVPPAEPVGKVNTSDPDSKNVKAFRGYVQGYNAQAVVTEQQIVIAAELNTDPQDFSHLAPMFNAAQRELASVGVTEQPEVVVADAGYWHFQQMDELAAQGVTVLIPPDSTKRKDARPGWDGGRYSFMRQVLAGPGRPHYKKRHTMIEPVFGQIKFNRKIDRFLRRGRSAARSEWRLAAATHNLMKLHRHQLTVCGV